MDILYLLVPMSVLAMLVVLGVFAWALQGGQFDGLEAEGARVLDPDGPALDPGQAPAGAALQEWPGHDSAAARNPA